MQLSSVNSWLNCWRQLSHKLDLHNCYQLSTSPEIRDSVKATCEAIPSAIWALLPVFLGVPVKKMLLLMTQHWCRHLIWTFVAQRNKRSDLAGTQSMTEELLSLRNRRLKTPVFINKATKGSKSKYVMCKIIWFWTLMHVIPPKLINLQFIVPKLLSKS